MGMICCFQDALSESLIKILYNMGPNSGLAFPSEESPDSIDINNRLVFFYSGRKMYRSCNFEGAKPNFC